MQFYRQFYSQFFRHESGTGREDWLLLSAIAAASTTFLSLWLSSGGAEQVTSGLRSIISGAVAEIGAEQPVPATVPLNGPAP